MHGEAYEVGMMKRTLIALALTLLAGVPAWGATSAEAPPYYIAAPTAAEMQQQNFGGGLPNGLVYSAPTFTVSSAGNGNGTIALSGNTSGTSSCAASAVAGTLTNPIVCTNSWQLPSGAVYNVNNDTGLSRDSAGVWDFGNGTAGDKSGSWNATNGVLSGTLTSVNGVATTGNGISLSVARLASTAQTTTINTTTLYAVPGTGATFSPYRLFGCVILTTAGSVSETIGPLVITYNDGTGARSINIGIGAVSPSTGVGSSTALTGAAGTYFCGILPMVAQGGTNIQYALSYTANAASSAVYSIFLNLDTF
jgi:hypothetical protein